MSDNRDKKVIVVIIYDVSLSQYNHMIYNIVHVIRILYSLMEEFVEDELLQVSSALSVPI